MGELLQACRSLGRCLAGNARRRLQMPDGSELIGHDKGTVTQTALALNFPHDTDSAPRFAVAERAHCGLFRSREAERGRLAAYEALTTCFRRVNMTLTNTGASVVMNMSHSNLHNAMLAGKWRDGSCPTVLHLRVSPQAPRPLSRPICTPDPRCQPHPNPRYHHFCPASAHGCDTAPSYLTPLNIQILPTEPELLNHPRSAQPDPHRLRTRKSRGILCVSPPCRIAAGSELRKRKPKSVADHAEGAPSPHRHVCGDPGRVWLDWQRMARRTRRRG